MIRSPWKINDRRRVFTRFSMARAILHGNLLYAHHEDCNGEGGDSVGRLFLQEGESSIRLPSS